jgi:hypothetical protein
MAQARFALARVAGAKSMPGKEIDIAAPANRSWRAVEEQEDIR